MATNAAVSPALLQVAEQRLRHLLEETPIGHADLDVDGVVQHANAALCAMLGVSERKLIGRSWLSLLVPADRVVVGAALQRLAAGVTPHVEGEHALLQHDGSTLPAYVFLRAQLSKRPTVPTPASSSAQSATEGEPPARITALVLDRSVRHAAF